MKFKIPFPYWLWEEIVLTNTPYNKMTIFRNFSGVLAILFAVIGYVIGQKIYGFILGFIFVLIFLILGYAMGYFALIIVERVLKFLVNLGIMVEPNFDTYKPMNKELNKTQQIQD